MALLSSIRTELKFALYRLIGLNARAVRHLDLYLSRRAYHKAYGRYPDLVRPVLFSEKVTARKLFDRRTVFPMLADKLLARDFAFRRMGGQFLPRLYQVCERFEEIDFDRLPEKFVIKTNHGTHWNVIVDDRKTFDRSAARKLVSRWMRTNYYVNSREVFYRDVERRIMVEEYLEEESGAPVNDYKFFIFDGATQLIAISRRKTVEGEREVAFYDRAYRQLRVQAAFPNSAYKARPASAGTGADEIPLMPIPLPANIDRLVEIAERLAQGFDFLRVDLYSPGGRVLVGELTTLPSGGVRPFEPPEFERTLGEYWNLTLSGPEPIAGRPTPSSCDI